MTHVHVVAVRSSSNVMEKINNFTKKQYHEEIDNYRDTTNVCCNYFGK